MMTSVAFNTCSIMGDTMGRKVFSKLILKPRGNLASLLGSQLHSYTMQAAVQKEIVKLKYICLNNYCKKGLI